MSDDVKVEHEPAAGRFVIRLPGGEAILRYRLQGKTADFFSTFVPEALRGKGLAEQLAQAAFEHAKAQGWQVIPSCSYLSGAYLKRHPEYQPLTQGRGPA